MEIKIKNLVRVCFIENGSVSVETTETELESLAGDLLALLMQKGYMAEIKVLK